MNKSTLIAGFLFLMAFSTYAVEAPTLDMGQTLFESAQLGTTEKSCSTCHAKGNGLHMVGDFNDIELKDIINTCLRDALKAKPISPESQEMEALVGYVRMFQKP